MGFRAVASEFTAEWRSFTRKKTAVFFTFLFPAIVVGVFGVLIETSSGGSGGLFSRPQGYYIPGYIAVVAVLTPLSRIGSTVARHRNNRRFEKLATTPLRRVEWLTAHILVNIVFIGGATLLLLGILVGLTDAEISFSPLLPIFIVLGVTMFCGIGAILGRVAESQDGVIAASNGIGLPMVFLGETFVTDEMLPDIAEPAINLIPLTYLSRGIRQITYTGGSGMEELGIVFVLTLVSFVAGVYLVPWRD